MGGGWTDRVWCGMDTGKFAAAVQQAPRPGNPVLTKVIYDSGYFTEDVEVTFANFSDQYAFVIW